MYSNKYNIVTHLVWKKSGLLLVRSLKMCHGSLISSLYSWKGILFNIEYVFLHAHRGFTGLSAIDFFEREGGLSRGKKEGSFVKQPSALAQRHKARVL